LVEGRWVLWQEFRMLLKLIFVLRDANGAFTIFVSGDSSNNDAQAIGLSL
jgi:hypothetical protein